MAVGGGSAGVREAGVVGQHDLVDGCAVSDGLRGGVGIALVELFVDVAGTELMENRLVWNESRFCFAQERDNNLGGNSLLRSEERIAAEKRYLKSKWKAHMRFETYKSQDRVAIDVSRRQSVALDP